MKKLRIIYCCMTCGNKICSITALKGKGSCHTCASSGSNNAMYKRGDYLIKHSCIKCSIGIIKTKSGMCKPCYLTTKSNNGSNNPNYKHGKHLKTYYCLECDIKLSGIYKLCASCSAKTRYKKLGYSPNTLKEDLYNNSMYKQWRIQIYKRDQYTCQECKQIGGNLEVHHLKPFSTLIQEFLQKYNQFSPLEDKETLVRLSESYEPFWDVSNGKTLCKTCHKATPTYGGKSIKV